MRRFLLILASAVLLAPGVDAAPIEASCDFKLEQWCAIDVVDGPVTIHRARITTTDRGFRSAGATSALNNEYVMRVGIQVEFSNEASTSYPSYITAWWEDAEGEKIDGFGDEEGLNKNRSHTHVRRSIGASKYGLSKAKTFHVKVEFNP